MRTLSLTRARLLVACLLFPALSACGMGLTTGRDNYLEGMRRLKYDPSTADSYFKASEEDLGGALSEDDLSTEETVLALTLRVRALIELERYTEVPGALSTARLEGYNPQRAYRGDLVGLALLKASRLDAERAYAELLLTEKKASTLRSRVHLAWEEVHLLQKLGTPKAKAEALKLCDAHAGKIDFDSLRRSMSNP